MAAPPPPPPTQPSSTLLAPVDTVSLVKDLEHRWDARFSRMETAIRSGLTNSVNSTPTVVDQSGASSSLPPAPGG